jgi:streptomycin 6-kinase
MIEEGEQETVGWLAEHTDLQPDEVEKGLEEGRLRRQAVVFELVDAGLTGRELLEMVVALTGLPAREARELIATEAPDLDLDGG